MGKGIGNRRYESCWSYRSTFEKALIISSLLPFIIVIVLVTFLLLQLHFVNRNLNSCNNAACKIEATHLAQRIDTSTNPCNNFYQFSCGSLWKDKNHTSDPFSTIIQDSKQQILQVYNEPIKVTDYRIVKAAKKLYQTCLNTTEIRKEDLDYLNRTLNVLGGWPVVWGKQWNESQFWWIPATEALRKMGLFYNSFIDISVVSDNKTESKYILKVAIPPPENTQIKDINDFFEVAMALGAQENETIHEYEEMYKFSLDLRREIFRRYSDDPPRKHTILAFQAKYELINWKDFINNIVGPTFKVQDHDEVIFDSADGFHQWINFLTKTSKRDQANYIIWKAIEQLLPYIQNTNQVSESNRPEFCIGEIRDRFSPSPLDIKYVQQYLPDTKISLAKDLVNNMKAEVLQLIENCEWLETAEKHRARERLSNMTQIVGAPKKCLNRDIFFQMDVDLGEFDETENSFMYYMLKCNRNHQSRSYQQVVKGPVLKWSLQTGSLIGDYYWDDNVISIPATVLQGAIFNEARPKYVNYGSIGMLLSHHFYRILIGEKVRIYDPEAVTETTVYHKLEDKLSNCLDLQLNNSYLVDIILQQSLGFQISYGAYKKSVHSKEDVGFSGYTPNQLYWLSAASYFCQPDSNFAYIVENSTEEHTFSNLFLRSIASNKHFGEDFQCDQQTKIHTKEKCSIF